MDYALLPVNAPFLSQTAASNARAFVANKCIFAALHQSIVAENVSFPKITRDIDTKHY